MQNTLTAIIAKELSLRLSFLLW